MFGSTRVIAGAPGERGVLGVRGIVWETVWTACRASGKFLFCLERAFNVWLCFAFDFSQGLNGQKKYQIHLKSTSGPIDVLLVNKDAWSSPPVVLPVPPPEDLIQCQAVAPAKPQIPPLTHFQEASVPTSTQPSTPTPTSTQDHSPPAQKAASTGEREATGGRKKMVADNGEDVPWPGWG